MKGASIRNSLIVAGLLIAVALLSGITTRWAGGAAPWIVAAVIAAGALAVRR